MLGKQPIGQVTLLVTDGCNDILGFLSHLVKEQIDNAEASFAYVDSLFWTELISDIGEMAANQGKGNDKPVLRRKFQTHLKVVLEQS